MRRKKQFLMAMLCAFSMVINSVPVVAQSKDKKQEPKSGAQQSVEDPGDHHFFFPPEPPFHMTFAGPAQDIAYAAPQVEFISHEFNFDGKVVKDAPYSADAVTETIQTLGDGNRIVRNSSSKIYRDSAGRTRREQAMKLVGPWAVSGDAPVMITINDPISGVHYNLNSSAKTAHKMSLPRMLSHEDAAKARAELKANMKDKLKLKAADGAESGAVATSVVTEVVTGGGANAAGLPVARSGERVVVGSATNTLTIAAGTAGVISAPDNVFAWTGDAEVNRESLGTQTIEGVAAEGTRVTFTIPAGKIGNERPIVTVNERWYSPELQTVVLSKNSDPRMGETTYRLTNIVRSEPDPSLFQVPSDYTVNENHSFNFRTGHPEPSSRIEVEKRTKRPDDN